MIPYLSPVVELYLRHMIEWDEYFALRKGPGVDARTERENGQPPSHDEGLYDSCRWQ